MTAGVIDVLVAIDVPFAGSGRAVDVNRMRFEESTVVRDTAGKNVLGTPIEAAPRLASVCSRHQSVANGRGSSDHLRGGGRRMFAGFNLAAFPDNCHPGRRTPDPEIAAR